MNNDDLLRGRLMEVLADIQRLVDATPGKYDAYKQGLVTEPQPKNRTNALYREIIHDLETLSKHALKAANVLVFG